MARLSKRNPSKIASTKKTGQILQEPCKWFSASKSTRSGQTAKISKSMPQKLDRSQLRSSTFRELINGSSKSNVGRTSSP